MRILLSALCLVLVACQTNPFSDTSDKLEYQVKVFEDTVRWGSLENMYQFLKAGDRSKVEVQKGLNNIRVTGYETSGLHMLSETRWAQTAVIDYVLTDRQVVRQLVDHQVWATDDDGKSWYRETPIPLFE